MKKNINRFLLHTAVLSLFTGCGQENFSNLNKKESLVFTATIADATRTSLQVDDTAGKVNWVDGDEITINGVTYIANPDPDNATVATFTKKNDSDADPELIGGKYYATYSCTYDVSKVAGVLPSEQSYTGETISAPMYAESGSTDLSFKNICGLLAFNLTTKKEDTSIESIIISTAENICGNFELVDGAASLTSGSKTVTVNCGDLSLSTSEATPFYVALPKGTYTDITFTINYTDKGIQKFSRQGDLVIAVNNLYNINLSVESKGGIIARYSNDGGSTWTDTASLADAIAGITATSRANGKVELFHNDACVAAALPDLSGKAFTLDGHGKTWDISERTAAIVTSTSTDVSFKDIVIDGRSQENGKRFLDNKGNVTFTGCEFKDIIFKVSSGNAYGIILNAGGYAYREATLTLEDCNIHDCESIGTNSYCFIDNDPGHVIMKGCKVADCKATGSGSIVRGGFLYNTQTTVGGVAEITDCSFSKCISSNAGGAICCYAGTVTLNNVTFDECSAKEGGALYGGLSSTSCPSSIIANGGSIKNCDASGNGCAAYFTKSNGTFNGTEIVSGGKDCIYIYNGGKTDFNDARLINTNASGTIFSSGSAESSARLTVNGGWYYASDITRSSSTTDNRIYIEAGYFNNNNFAQGTNFGDSRINKISETKQTIDGKQYAFTYKVEKYVKPAPTENSFGAYKHVIILGVDGAGAWFDDNTAPNCCKIFKYGVFANNIKCATPSLSAECWGSMLHGVKPEFHTRNNTNTGKERFDPASPYPSIFRVIREANPSAELASICNWNNVNYGIIEEGIGVNKQHATSDRAVTDLILTYLKSNDPTLLYVQYDGVDHQGHASGYGKTKHLASITTTDGYIQEVYDLLMKKGILDETLFIVSVDHGGTPGGSHGGSTAAEITTFLGVAGKTTATHQTVVEGEGRDIAAIVAHALGLKVPETWTGRVPTGIFYDVTGTERKEMPSPGQPQYESPTLSSTKTLLNGHNVIAYFPFDGDANDAYGVTSTTLNGKQYYRDELYGKVLDPQDGYITLNNVKFGTNSFSIAFWVRNNGVGSDPSIISNKNWASGYNKGFICSMTSTKIQFNVGDGATSNRKDGYDRCYVSATYPSDFDGRWMHVVITVDRPGNVVKMYYDFNLVQTFTLSDAMKGISFDALNLNIGQDGTGSYNAHLTALLDEMIICGDLLSDSDIAAMKTHYAR